MDRICGMTGELEEHRPAIEGLIYRMSGDWGDAEDIAQETFLKWHSLSADEQSAIAVPRSWLMKVASRMALDRAKSARNRRETYVGPWLPEPWLVQERSPSDEMETDESVTLALMLALEQLSASERASFILREVFDFSYNEISDVLGKSSVACRQLCSRARSSLREGKTRFEFSHQKHRELLTAFAEASDKGDLNELKKIFAEDVAIHSDGGGQVPAARRVLHSREVALRFFLGLAQKARKRKWTTNRKVEIVNGLPTLLLFKEENLETLISFSVVESQVKSIFIQRNPEKLKRICVCKYCAATKISTPEFL